MSSSDESYAIQVQNVVKEYRVYAKPHERVMQAIATRVGRRHTFGFVVKAVTDVSFTLKRGETLAIIGRNGSGKSTLLEMITGTLTQTSGSIDVRGRISALLELGAGFNPDFTGRENYRLNASILGLTDDQIVATEPAVEAFAELGDFMDEPVRTYSSGMYVRLAFATAVHVKPEILVVDEALAVGDVFFQQKCFDFLENELADVTKLLVTHDLAMAVKFADRCVVMDHGVLVFDGPPLEAVQAYTALSLRNRGSAVRPDDSGATVIDPDEGVVVADSPMTGGRAVTVDSSTNPDVFRVDYLAGEQQDTLTGISEAMSGHTWVCVPHRRITVRARVYVGATVAEPVVGFLVRDRVGNAVFGQNSVGSGFGLDAMTPGVHLLEFAFVWPEVEPGDYLLTLGLGDGLHPHHHRIVGWAQGVAAFTSTPDRPVHGMWNNDMLNVEVHRMAAGSPANPQQPQGK